MKRNRFFDHTSGNVPESQRRSIMRKIRKDFSVPVDVHVSFSAMFPDGMRPPKRGYMIEVKGMTDYHVHGLLASYFTPKQEGGKR